MMQSIKKNILTKNIFLTFGLLIVFTEIAYIFYILTNTSTNIAIVYILYVLLVARLTTGYAWGIIASIFGVIGVNYLFTYPFMQLNFSLTGYPVTFLCMLTISVITSALTTHVKEQTRIALMREEALHKLNDVNKELICSESIEQIIELTLSSVMNFAHTSVAFYKEDPLDNTEPIVKLLDEHCPNIFNSPSERAAAHICYVGEKCLPPYTDGMNAKGLYLSIASHNIIWGVLGLYSPTLPKIDSDTLSFLNLMITQVALALESRTLANNHEALAIETEKEKTRANLLRAISHDLRTPLTGMIGASAAYLENSSKLTSSEMQQLVFHIHEDANWLLHMVENLLSITRIEQQTAKVTKNLEAIEEVIAEALSRIKKRYKKASIQASIPSEFIMVPMDATLIEQVIINLVENAIKYSHTNDPILLNMINKNDFIEIEVIDNGIGIDPDKLESIFDASAINNHTRSDASKGMGVGLSICKTIIKAHGGTITATNLEKGVKFAFTLPLKGDEMNE